MSEKLGLCWEAGELVGRAEKKLESTTRARAGLAVGCVGLAYNVGMSIVGLGSGEGQEDREALSGGIGGEALSGSIDNMWKH